MYIPYSGKNQYDQHGSNANIFNPFLFYVIKMEFITILNQK